MSGNQGDGATSESAELSIVVVEDNEDDARMTLRPLRDIRPVPKFTLIDNGALALEKLTGPEAIHPDLILLDLKLPKVHGLEILRALKSAPSTSATAVIVLTSSDEPSDVNTAHELGCADYICKPVEWQDYLNVVSNAVTTFVCSKR